MFSAVSQYIHNVGIRPDFVKDGDLLGVVYADAGVDRRLEMHICRANEIRWARLNDRSDVTYFQLLVQTDGR